MSTPTYEKRLELGTKVLVDSYSHNLIRVEGVIIGWRSTNKPNPLQPAFEYIVGSKIMELPLSFSKFIYHFNMLSDSEVNSLGINAMGIFKREDITVINSSIEEEAPEQTNNSSIENEMDTRESYKRDLSDVFMDYFNSRRPSTYKFEELKKRFIQIGMELYDHKPEAITKDASQDCKKIAKLLEQQEEFEKAVTSVMNYLTEYHDPHCTVIIHSTGAELVEGVKAYNLDYDIDEPFIY